MKNVFKRDEPKSLVKHRLRQGGFDDAGDWKSDLKKALLSEQGGICCYCMCRITEEAMKIEHLKCQERNKHLSLDYRNLLAACKGGEGSPQKLQHCDTRKANRDIGLNPTGDVERFINYLADGTLKVTDLQHDGDINIVLNLNTDNLVRSRKDAYTACSTAVSARLGQTTWRKEDLERVLEKWQELDAKGNFRPFVQVGVALIRKQIRKRHARSV